MKAEYFREPAWNILLELYILTIEGQKEIMMKHVVPTGLVPYSTAVRYIDMLDAEGELLREKIDRDRRVTLVFLTDQGRVKIETALSAMIEAEERFIAPHRFTRTKEPLPDRSFEWVTTAR